MGWQMCREKDCGAYRGFRSDELFCDKCEWEVRVFRKIYSWCGTQLGRMEPPEPVEDWEEAEWMRRGEDRPQV